jgi:hypothetical protein
VVKQEDFVAGVADVGDDAHEKARMCQLDVRPPHESREGNRFPDMQQKALSCLS